MADSSEIGPGEEILTDPNQLLLRNIHPDWVVNGKVTSQAFRPTPKDERKLSTTSSSKVSAEDSFREYTEDFELASAGVWGVSVGEAADLSIRAIYDEHSPSIPKPCLTGHTSLDFAQISNNKAKRLGGRLRDRAEDRGRQHPSADA